MARQNLLSNPNFTVDTTGWVGLSAATLLHYHQEDRPCVKVTKSSLANSGIISENFISGIVPGLDYAASAYVFIPANTDDPAALSVGVVWYKYNSGTQEYDEISSSESLAFTVSYGNGWVRLSKVAAAPALTTHAKFRVYQPSGGVDGENFLVDSVLFEQASYVGAFIDNLSQAEETEKVNRALSTYRDLNHLTGLQLNADVQLGDLVFNTIDEDDIVWICTDIDGWWTTAEVEVPDIPRGFEDGSYDVSGRYTSRSFQLTGMFIPQRPSDIAVARDKLLEAANLVRKGAWLRTSEEPTKASFVRLASRPQIQTVNARGRTEFSLSLRAGDPIKYKWDDSKVDGITSEVVNLTGDSDESKTVVITNEGTANVTAKLVFTGPLGAGSTVEVYHVDDDTTETLTIIEPLRGVGPVATVTFIEMTNNIVTITTQEAHGLSIGEAVQVSGTADSTTNGVINTASAVITSVTDTLPYTFSYTAPGSNTDLEKVTSFGTVSTIAADEMILDTYHRNVTVNGESTGYRSKLDTLTDWITLHPGDNQLTFTDSVDTKFVSSKTYNSTTNLVTLTTNTSHFLGKNDSVTISFPEEATISFKEILDDVITITTKTAHGFSVGDKVSVETTLDTTITSKAVATGTTVTLGVADGTAVSNGDEVVVSLPTTAAVATKSRSSNTVTLTTTAAHGFSNGDKVTIPFSTDATITKKAFENNSVTLTTAEVHNFSTADSILIALPSTTTVNAKSIFGTTVTLTTAAAHGYVVGDKIDVALPATATQTASRKFGGAASYIPTHKAASGENRTLTLPSTHNFTVGDSVTIYNIDGRFNGTYDITAVNAGAKTFTYVKTGDSSPDITTTPTSGYVVNNTMSYRLTINTSAAHNFVVGDTVTINCGLDATMDASSRKSTTTTRTLTITGHQFAVGEVVEVTGINANYNGTYAISAVRTDEIDYVAVASLEETATAISPAVVVTNKTIRDVYNGTKVITSIPTTSSFTCLYYGQDSYSSNTNTGTTPTPTLVNTTNQAINGTGLTLTAASGTTLQYTRTV